MQLGDTPGKSKAEPPPHKWGEFWGSAIAILTLILPVAAIVHYSPASRVQALPNLPPAVLPKWAKDKISSLNPYYPIPNP